MAVTSNSTLQPPSRRGPNRKHPRRREVARRYCVARNTPCLAATSQLSGPAVRFFGAVSKTTAHNRLKHPPKPNGPENARYALREGLVPRLAPAPPTHRLRPTSGEPWASLQFSPTLPAAKAHPTPAQLASARCASTRGWTSPVRRARLKHSREPGRVRRLVVPL